MAYTLEQLSTMMDSLTARVAALDGIGLANPSLAVTTVWAREIEGLRTMINQYSLTIQDMIQTLQTQLNMVQQTLTRLTQNQQQR